MKETVNGKAMELRAKGMKVRGGFNRVMSKEEEWMWNEKERKMFHRTKEKGKERGKQS